MPPPSADAVPRWFRTEVLARLSGVRAGQETGQYYARCPVTSHGDRHRSFAIRPGDKMAIVYHCQAGCTDEEIRDALAGLGVPEEYLGLLGTPEYEARHHRLVTSEERRQIEQLQGELAGLRNSLRGLLRADLTPALLKIRILATADGVEVPTHPKRAYVEFAMRAGVPEPSAYRAWDVDPLVRGQDQCVTGDHVVLTRSEGNRQAAQVSEPGAVLETRRPLSEREDAGSRNENSRNENDETSAAVEVLRRAGLTNPAA